MKRFSTLFTLFLFMFMLGWVAQIFQQDLPPREETSLNLTSELARPENEKDQAAERITLPYRSADNLEEQEPGAGRAEVQTGDKDEKGPEEPLPSTRPGASFSSPGKENIHFLLLGRTWDCKKVDFLMVVTLSRGSHSILTAVDPSHPSEYNDVIMPTASILQNGGTYNDLCRAVYDITGLQPQFYIDLNINGFIEMLNLLGGINQEVYLALAGDHTPAVKDAGALDGLMLLSLLAEPDLKVKDKEILLQALLITARDIQNTALGLSLLWTGYHNIETNLGLKDLLAIRRITQEISPTRVILREIRAPAQ